MIQKAKPVEEDNEESSYLQSSNKENKFVKRKLKKKVTFEDLESAGVSVQEAEIHKLEERVCYLSLIL